MQKQKKYLIISSGDIERVLNHNLPARLFSDMKLTRKNNMPQEFVFLVMYVKLN